MATSTVFVVLAQNGTTWEATAFPGSILMNSGNTHLVLEAVGTGANFPEAGAFQWNTDPAPLDGRLPTRSSDGKRLSLAYDNTFDVTWQYTVFIQNPDTPNPVRVDPEIDNGPPGT